MEEKNALRRRMKAAREGWEAEYRQKADAAIARHLLERMGGSIEARLEDRDGAPWLVFRIALPAA